MYSSDITNKEWLILAPFIAQGKMGRPRTHDIRQIINVYWTDLSRQIFINFASLFICRL